MWAYANGFKLTRLRSGLGRVMWAAGPAQHGYGGSRRGGIRNGALLFQVWAVRGPFDLPEDAG